MSTQRAILGREANIYPRQPRGGTMLKCVGTEDFLMSSYIRVLFTVVLFFSCLTALADKKKALPAYVLKARTISVLVDPQAGIALEDPLANQTARGEVEKAIMKWGRFTVVFEGMEPDLIIVVRKGQGRRVQPTISSGPIPSDGPVIVQPADPGIRIGAQGRPPNSTQTSPRESGPHPQVEAGPTEDMFVLYEGGVDHPQRLDRPPVWRYLANDALHSPDVPAVAEFRKLIEESEKQQKPKP
jgi:hypothetical protein